MIDWEAAEKALDILEAQQAEARQKWLDESGGPGPGYCGMNGYEHVTS